MRSLISRLRLFPGVALALLLALSRSAGEEPARPESVPAEVVVDAARGEVRVPCRFVNPTELLEVFACHEEGPVHETVVAFSARGDAICEALREIGVRPASFWNATGPNDFLQNQGDRVLVLLRWQEDGLTREYPAEAILDDGETGFPSFVRGFSFGARDRPAPRADGEDGSTAGKRESNDGAQSEPPAEEPEAREASAEAPKKSEAPVLAGRDRGAVEGCANVPPAVEISLGATSRQRPSYSLLSHPTHSQRWRPWVLPPVLDRDVVRNLATLVEERASAVLVLRRIRREADVLRADEEAAIRRGDTARARLADKLVPLARKIDGLKDEYASLVADLETAVEAGSAPGLPAAEVETLQRRVLELLGRGRELSGSIEELYWRIWARQEEYKLNWLSSRPGIDLEARIQAETYARFGPILEARIVSEQAALQRLARARREGEDVKAASALARKRLAQLHTERALGIARANVGYFERRVKEAPDDYVRGIFLEDLAVARGELFIATGRERLAAVELRELEEGGASDATTQAELVAARARARVEIALGELEKGRGELTVERRWLRDDLEAARSEAKRAEHAGKLQSVDERLRSLDEKIRQKKAQLEQFSAEK